MKKILTGSLIALAFASFGQDSEATLGQAIDDLTYKWDTEANNLNNYDGLTKFCVDQEYRYGIIEILNEIHHFDSVLYGRLVKAARFSHDKEVEKTIKDIEKFEKDYSMKEFIHFLHEECKARSEIEKNAKESKNDIGYNSYDGQIYMVETELNKYIKHITKRVDVIRKHVHHLHIK